MEPRFRLAAITDEFSPNLKIALQGMTAAMLQGAELRMIFNKNVVDLSDEEVDRAIDMIRGRDFEIVSIASPLLKCELPGAPPVDARFRQDVFASQHGFDDQPRLTRRAFDILRRLSDVDHARLPVAAPDRRAVRRADSLLQWDVAGP
jgi:hypothetical protein